VYRFTLANPIDYSINSPVNQSKTVIFQSHLTHLLEKAVGGLVNFYLYLILLVSFSVPELYFEFHRSLLFV